MFSDTKCAVDFVKCAVDFAGVYYVKWQNAMEISDGDAISVLKSCYAIDSTSLANTIPRNNVKTSYATQLKYVT